MSSGITVDIKFKKPNKVYFENVSIYYFLSLIIICIIHYCFCFVILTNLQ